MEPLAGYFPRLTSSYGRAAVANIDVCMTNVSARNDFILHFLLLFSSVRWQTISLDPVCVRWCGVSQQAMRPFRHPGMDLDETLACTW